ncbi:MAG: homoserine kinase [Chloroflexota bacterium]
MPHAVEVFAPATIANLGSGFDILGMALAAPYDTIYAERTEVPGVVIESITGDNQRLPRDAEKNTAGIAARFVLDQLMIHDYGVKLRIHKGLPLESGMGSSAASAAGAAVAVNALYDNLLRREELLLACVEAEAAVSGRHADNVAPALLGGIVLITGLTPDSIYKLPVPDDLVLALVTPAVAVPTTQARAVLPKTIPFSDYVQQSAGVALLITAIHRGDVALMADAMSRDILVEPAREHLMPGLREVRQAAHLAGALTTVISGAGPTLCSICNSTNVARLVTEATQAVYDQLGIAATTLVTTPSRDGITLRVVEI